MPPTCIMDGRQTVMERVKNSTGRRPRRRPNAASPTSAEQRWRSMSVWQVVEHQASGNGVPVMAGR